MKLSYGEPYFHHSNKGIKLVTVCFSTHHYFFLCLMSLFYLFIRAKRFMLLKENFSYCHAKHLKQTYSNRSRNFL